MAATATFHRVPVDQLYIDDRYQRELDETRVQRMVKQFDPRQLGTLEVSQRNGKGSYAVFDGQHRLALAHQIGLGSLPCLIHKKLTPEDEADLFVRLQGNRKTVHPVDRFRARVFCGDETAVAIDRIVTEAGYKVTVAGADRGRHRQFNTPGALEAVYAMGVLPATLELLDMLWGGDDNSTAAPVIQGLAVVLKGYGHRIGEKERARLKALSPTTIVRRAAVGDSGASTGKKQRVERAAAEIRRAAGLRGTPRIEKAAK